MNELSTLADWKKKKPNEIFGMYLREAWYFEKWYEKIILILFGIMGMWKMVGLVSNI